MNVSVICTIVLAVDIIIVCFMSCDRSTEGNEAVPHQDNGSNRFRVAQEETQHCYERQR